MLKVGRVLHRRSGDAHDLATDLGQLDALRNRRLRVHCVAGDHRLDPNRVGAADAHPADHHFARQTALIVEKVVAIGKAAHVGQGCAEG